MNHTFRATLRWLTLLVCGLSVCACAWALGGEPLLQRFTPADFKATPYLFGLASDADGRIYVGNNDGLLRMQGHEWETIPLPGGMAAGTLARGRDGHVYLGGYDSFGMIETAADGGVVYRDLRDAFGLRGAARALGSVWQVLPVSNGIYFQTQHRILFYRFDGHHQQWPSDGIEGAFSVYRDQLYVLRKDFGLQRFDNGRLQPVPGGDVMRGHRGVEMIDQGDSAVALSVGGFYRLRDGQVSALAVPPVPASAGIFSTVHVLRDKGFVVGTSTGQLLLYDADAHLLEQHALAHNSIGAMDYDAEGGLWAIADDELLRLQLPSPWSRIDVADMGGVVSDCEWHRGALWLAVGSRGLERISDGPDGRRIDWIAGENKRQVFGLTSTDSGLLVAYDSGMDVITDDDQVLPLVHGDDQAVYTIERSKFNPELAYAAGDAGVYVLRRTAGKWALARLLPAPELATQLVTETAPGVLWVNNSRGMPERWTIDTATAQLRKRESFELKVPGHRVDADQGWRQVVGLLGQIYLTVGRDAYHFDGRAFVPYSGPPFSYMQSPNAFTTIDTPVGAFAYTGSRLYRHDKNDNWTRVDFGAMPSASQSVLRYGSDGVLRLSVWRAILQYRPDTKPVASERPLTVRLTAASRTHPDGTVESLPIDTQGRLTLTQDEALNLHFSVFIAEPGVEYRYRAPGIIDTFTDWREQGSLGFSGLNQPGDHMLEVQARTPSGRAVQPLHYAFTIEPRWYQTTLVRLLIALGALVVLLVLIRWRERRQARLYADRQQRLEEKIAERTVELEVANRKLEELATEDGLTGVANRRALETGLQREWRRCFDQRVPIALLMIDVDRFKQYNDQYGHVAGDAVLKEVAERLSAGLEPQRELLARYGGEEFCLLLPGIALDAAQQRAESLRKRFDVAGSPVTISIGVAAHVPRADDSAEALLRAADQVLYEAKRRGRNRVEVADSQ